MPHKLTAYDLTCALDRLEAMLFDEYEDQSPMVRAMAMDEQIDRMERIQNAQRRLITRLSGIEAKKGEIHR